jgi:hypothetical protein
MRRVRKVHGRRLGAKRQGSIFKKSKILKIEPFCRVEAHLEAELSSRNAGFATGECNVTKDHGFRQSFIPTSCGIRQSVESADIRCWSGPAIIDPIECRNPQS